MSTVQQARGAVCADGFAFRPHGRAAPVLSEVSFTVQPGERVLLLGPSGAGKSTLLRGLAGLLDESLGEAQGSITLDGSDPQDQPGRVGLMLQDPGHSWVAQHAGRDAAFGPENRRDAPGEVRRRAADCLTAVGFPYDASRETTALSGGEQQRLSLAGALALDPDVLLLDEPTAMLDPAATALVCRAVIDAVTDRALTLVVVDHRIGAWSQICSRTLVMDDSGRLIADGPTGQILTEHAARLLDAGIWVPGVAAPRSHPARDRFVSGASAGRDGHPAGDGGSVQLRGLAIASPEGRQLATGIDLDLPPGTLTVITGHSGAGKSTLLHTMAGITTPTSGTVMLPGPTGPQRPADLAPAELARTVAWLPQRAELLWTRRTVREEVQATSAALHPGSADAQGDSADHADLLERLGLQQQAEVDPYWLSGGEQRRLGLAAVTAHAPRVLLLDEPTVGQDRQTWAAMLELIMALRDRGTIIVAASHDQELIARADRRWELPGTVRGDRAAIDVPADPAPRRPVDHTVTEVRVPGSAPAARCNPLTLVIIALGGVIGSFFVTDARVGLLTVVISLLMIPWVVRPLTWRGLTPTLARMVPVTVAALTVGWSTLVFSTHRPFSSEALAAAMKEITRIGCLVLPGVILVGVLDPSRLGDALAQRCRLPHRPVVAGTAALLRLQLLRDDWRAIQDVRRIRGLAPGRSLVARARHLASMTFTLLVHVLRQAQVMATSMDARGFASARRRTFALPSPWRPRDHLALGLAVALVLVPLLLSRA